jgi:hypothetical protein
MAKVLTITFTGLLVFHRLKRSPQPDIFEIGIVPVRSGNDQHVPKMLTYKHGRVTKITPLPEPSSKQVWQLVVDSPAFPKVSTQQDDLSDVIDRITFPASEDDFRWIINLANSEFPYGDLAGKLDVSKLLTVVQVPLGRFYTVTQSPFLLKEKNHDPATHTDFGPMAATIGCDIPILAGGAKLIGSDPTNPIFTFDYDPDVNYELANTPNTIDPGEKSTHFHHYYDLFKTMPADMFEFLIGGIIIHGPNPALCGSIYVGDTGGGLTTTVMVAGKSSRRGKSRTPEEVKKSGGGKKTRKR